MLWSRTQTNWNEIPAVILILILILVVQIENYLDIAASIFMM